MTVDNRINFDLFKRVVVQILNLLPGSKQQLLKVRWSILQSKQKKVSKFYITKGFAIRKKKERRIFPKKSSTYSRSEDEEESSGEEEEEEEKSNSTNEKFFTIESKHLQLQEISTYFKINLHKASFVIKYVLNLLKSEFSQYFPSNLFMYVMANNTKEKGTPVLQVNSFQGN